MSSLKTDFKIFESHGMSIMCACMYGIGSAILPL